tara:strand:- start:4903 stop:5184 length:282 start_codon:yes stop_codon:yes gene_type:complete
MDNFYRGEIPLPNVGKGGSLQYEILYDKDGGVRIFTATFHDDGIFSEEARESYSQTRSNDHMVVTSWTEDADKTVHVRLSYERIDEDPNYVAP